MSKREYEYEDDWSEYKKVDPRKRNHHHDRTNRQLKHMQPDEVPPKVGRII